jgi:hypothetical protein
VAELKGERRQVAVAADRAGRIDVYRLKRMGHAAGWGWVLRSASGRELIARAGYLSLEAALADVEELSVAVAGSRLFVLGQVREARQACIGCCCAAHLHPQG